jgi:hypothetical protein
MILCLNRTSVHIICQKSPYKLLSLKDTILRERSEWRQMKRDMARQEQVFSFMDQLVEQYENEDSSVRVVCLPTKCYYVTTIKLSRHLFPLVCLK